MMTIRVLAILVMGVVASTRSINTIMSDFRMHREWINEVEKRKSEDISHDRHKYSVPDLSDLAKRAYTRMITRGGIEGALAELGRVDGSELERISQGMHRLASLEAINKLKVWERREPRVVRELIRQQTELVHKIDNNLLDL